SGGRESGHDNVTHESSSRSDPPLPSDEKSERHSHPTEECSMPRLNTMRRTISALILLWISVLLWAATAQADPALIAIGSISGRYEDFALETAAPLENGVPGNRLGGMGSGLAYAGGTTFLALPDRGPNAKAYNGGVDDTASYIARFQTLNLSLAPSDPG